MTPWTSLIRFFYEDCIHESIDEYFALLFEHDEPEHFEILVKHEEPEHFVKTPT